MPKPPGERPTPHRGRRLLTTVCVALALLAPATFTTVQYWNSTASEATFTVAEQRGVAYLRPLTALIAVLADNQSAAVAGHTVKTDEVRRAMSMVARADETDGRSLRVHDTWVNLQSDLSILLGSPPSGLAAFSAYSAVVDQALFLAARVGDTSNLILDPALDAYYLMDAALLRLPKIMVESGRMSDLNLMRLGGGNADLSRVLVARDHVSGDSTALQSGLSKSFGFTASPTFGPDLLSKVDAFRAAVGALAPSTALISQPLPTDQNAVSSGRTVLLQASMQLDIAVLEQLNGLLQVRLDAQQGGVRQVVRWWVVGLLAALCAALSALLGLGRGIRQAVNRTGIRRHRRASAAPEVLRGTRPGTGEDGAGRPRRKEGLGASR
ncbi:hypothetical protein KNE206_57190 [Kitasatospora sp. NE20-6]|uniref:hypothetical protein n=1 Tax=Kitasatospora sp. NE20-6 TaxID=2859066 RepID=UPI0034DB9035